MSSYNPAFELAFCLFWCHFLVGSLFNHNLSILYNRIIGTNSSYFIAVCTWTCFSTVDCTPLPAGHFVDVDLDRSLLFSVSSFILRSLMQLYRDFRFIVRNLIAVWIWTCLRIVSCTHLSVGHFMDVDLNRCLFPMVISFVLQAFARVCRGPPAASKFILQRMQFDRVFTLFEQFGRYGVITVVSSGIALGMQSCQVFLQWSFANLQIGTECVPRLLSRFEISTIANHHMVGYESGKFRCLAFLLCGMGFSWIGGQLLLSVTRNFCVTLQSKVGNLRQTFHEFSSTAPSGVSPFYRGVGKVFHPAPGLGKFYLGMQKVLRWSTCLQSWPLIYFVTVQLADGSDLEPYSMGSVSECHLLRDEPSSHRQISMSWAVPFICSAFCLIFTWMLQKWWRNFPVAPFNDGSDGTMIRAMSDRVNEENNSLRRQVSLLNGQLSEFSSVVRGLREDLYAASADHERLAEQVDWQHVGMVRLGGFSPFQSLSIDQRQQVFARERRNMMAYHAVGPDRFMATVLHQDRLLGLQSDFSTVGGVGARLDYPRVTGREPPSHRIQ